MIVGSAVYVFGMQLDSPNGTPIKDNSLDFVLDGQLSGHYAHTPRDGDDYKYNVQFYATSDLNHGSHNLSISLHGTSMVFFDYIIYTTK